MSQVIGATLGTQYVVPRIKEQRKLHFLELGMGIVLFSTLLFQISIRLAIVDKGYELERIREQTLGLDAELRQMHFDYEYLTRPEFVIEKAKSELKLELLPPQNIRQIAVISKNRF